MKKSILSIIKKSMVTVLAVALSVSMVQPAEAAKKKPSLRMKTYYLVHQLQVLAVDDGVHRQVRLHAVLAARSSNLAQVVNGKVVG